MADIEGTKRISQQATLLLPVRKKKLVTIEGSDGEPIEGTEA
jgi:hypothetical protein